MDDIGPINEVHKGQCVAAEFFVNEEGLGSAPANGKIFPLGNPFGQAAVVVPIGAGPAVFGFNGINRREV